MTVSFETASRAFVSFAGALLCAAMFVSAAVPVMPVA